MNLHNTAQSSLPRLCFIAVSSRQQALYRYFVLGTAKGRKFVKGRSSQPVKPGPSQFEAAPAAIDKPETVCISPPFKACLVQLYKCQFNSLAFAHLETIFLT